MVLKDEIYEYVLIDKTMHILFHKQAVCRRGKKLIDECR